MHRIAALPGGWNPDEEGVVFVEQTPATIVMITAADTDIQTLSSTVSQLPSDFPPLRVTNLLNLQQQLTIDTYAEDVLEKARVIILRLLGGRAYWSYGLEVVQELVARSGIQLIVLPGDDRPDPDLTECSTVPMAIATQVWRYFSEGGIENAVNALNFIGAECLGLDVRWHLPRSIPSVGLYHFSSPNLMETTAKVGILFYRSHYLAGNTAPIDALCEALIARRLQPIPVFVSSLRDPDVQTDIVDYFQPKDQDPIHCLLNTTSFAIAQLSDAYLDESPQIWETLNVPILQVILSGGTIEQWRSHPRGLSPRDMAMNVALPEVDGRIMTRAISFKAVETYDAALETNVVKYEPLSDRIEFVADLTANWVRLRTLAVSDRKVALILANYPTRDGRIANGVGLDVPESCVEILKVLKIEGYMLPEIPQDSDALMNLLTQGMTNDPEGRGMRKINQKFSNSLYRSYFSQLPDLVQQQVRQRWGEVGEEDIAIAGIQLGNVFVGIQPARGYDQDPSLNYHAPDLEPTHEYLAFYAWLQREFHAIAHVGKHGNLEWLPGKSIALSEECFPEAAIGPMPNLYPFIVNDPGEGTQAKRRSQAVIIDHLTPPMTRAELYGPLQLLESLIDEYYEAQDLDPSRMKLVRDRITELIATEHLDRDLGIDWDPNQENAFDFGLLPSLDGYLCELKESQIRDGLHIFGQCPQGRQLRDLILAIARQPSPGRMGLTRAIAESWNLELDPLTAEMGEGLESDSPDLKHCRTVGDAIAQIETYAAQLVDELLNAWMVGDSVISNVQSLIKKELQWIQIYLLPRLHQTSQEMTNLIRGFNGEYVAAGSSGAPTRGRSDVLPTGRNFYSVDIRSLPTETAWDVGRKAAEAVIERYTQEQGEYPKTLGLSVWGTATMRTGGDDMAEALALLGVQPVWEGAARRVVDFEILPLSVLGRPRVDVTLRISGFFRDAFANLIDLFDQAVVRVSELDEPEEWNPLAARVKHDVENWMAQGVSLEQAIARSRYRIFGSKPGAYGAGLQGLIESQNWQSDRDLAQAYLNWSSYAYTGQGIGHSAPEALARRLTEMQIVLQNQDNREHDLLDSDDYYQFQGGLSAAVRSLSGETPTLYFGDHSQIENPKVRHLREEIARVYRSRVVNPKWIEGAMRHGYKGAFEMAATVDFLFAYDATTGCVEEFMYEGVAEAYVLNSAVQEFIQQKNPWALRDVSERLLEAHQRGLWATATREVLDQLRAIALRAEGKIESTTLTGLGG